MKKILMALCILTFFSAAGVAFADGFDSLEGLSPVQKQKLTQIQYNFRQENDSLNTRIMDYQDKINQIKKQTDKTPEQINLLTAAYERNLSTLKSQQEQLKKQTEDMYKSVMTLEQYKQYQAQQLQAENAFSDFLRK